MAGDREDRGPLVEVISSIAAPPTTCRVTTNGARPENDSTLAAIDDPGPGGDVGHQLVAAVGAGGHHHHRAGGLPDGQDRRGPAGPGVRRDALAADAVHGAHAVRRQLAAQPRSVPGTSPTTTASTGTPLPAAERSRANVTASSETSIAAPSRSVSTRMRIIVLSTPSSLEQVDDGRRGRGALAEDLHGARRRWGQRQPDPLGPVGSASGAALLDGHLLGLDPAGDRRVARLDAALADRHDRRQRHPVGLLALGALALATTTGAVRRPVIDDSRWRR